MKRKLAYTVLATVLALVLLLAVTEGVASLLLHYREREPRFPRSAAPEVCLEDRRVLTQPDPYVLFRHRPNQEGAYARTNKYGLRNESITKLPGPDVVRVLFLGGSVAWGYAARTAEEAIPALLEDYLTEQRDRHPALRGKTVEVLNAGVSSYVAWQGALAYATRWRELTPHVIVTLDGANDVYAALRTGRAGWPQRYVDPGARYLESRPTLLGSVWNWLRYRASNLRSVEYWRTRHPTEVASLAPPEPDDVARAYCDALCFLADLSQSHSVVVLAVLQPMAVLEGTKELTEYESSAAAWHERELPGVNEYYARCYEALRERSGALFAGRTNARFLDATDVFRKERELIYTDHCHLTLRGRRLLARAIGEEILQGDFLREAR